jgi:hypothetical protein
MSRIDEGILIDSSEEHQSKTDSPRDPTLHSGANVTEKASQSLKQPAEMALMPPQIFTVSSFPKYRTKQVSLISTRKYPQTLKNGFPSSTMILSSSEPLKARPVTWQRLAGIQIDFSEHRKKANLPRSESKQPASKLKCESLAQAAKQLAEIFSTADGIQIELSDKQFSNADSPRTATLEPGSDVNCSRFWQELKQHLQIDLIDEGIQIDWSDEQPSNADSPRINTLHSLANFTDKI